MKSTEQKVIDVFTEHLGYPADALTADKTLEDIGCDSLDIVECGAELEDEFGIEISDEEVGNLHTIQDAIDLVKRLI